MITRCDINYINTSIIFESCLIICSITWSFPEVTIVIIEDDGLFVGATESDSILSLR